MKPFIATATGKKMNPEYVAMLRKMTVAEKFRKARELRDLEIANRVAALREIYPDLTEDESDRTARCTMLHQSIFNEG